MARLTVEHAWIEFPVSFGYGAAVGVSRTGGEIDRERSVVTALRDISFELREGDRLGLIGHNGAGKTTMLRMLAGAYPPTRGRVVSVGRISTLFNATPGLSPDGTGRENIVTCGLHLGLTRRQIAARMDEIIDFAELGDYIDLPVRTYSAGMTTRLGFSIATAVEPEILLLDEGLATGDAQFAQKANQRMNELISRSSILVLASHSEALLAGVCTRCLLLEHGHIVADGRPKSVLDDYRAAVVAAASGDDPAGLQRAYQLATNMLSAGETPPLELEERSLRYALGLRPGDPAMTQRYLDVMRLKGKTLAPAVEAGMILTVLAHTPDHSGLRARLATILPAALDALDPEQRACAEALAGREVQASR